MYTPFGLRNAWLPRSGSVDTSLRASSEAAKESSGSGITPHPQTPRLTRVTRRLRCKPPCFISLPETSCAVRVWDHGVRPLWGGSCACRRARPVCAVSFMRAPVWPRACLIPQSLHLRHGRSGARNRTGRSDSTMTHLPTPFSAATAATSAKAAASQPQTRRRSLDQRGGAEGRRQMSLPHAVVCPPQLVQLRRLIRGLDSDENSTPEA